MRALRATSILAAVMLCAAAAATAAPPGAHRETARSGAWVAVLSYVKKSAGGLPRYTRMRLALSNASTTVYDAPVLSRVAGAGQLQPGGFGRPSLRFRDLDADGTPELLLDLYTGGAHCCFLTQVFDLVASPPRKRELDFADAGARLIVVGGRVLFRTNDPVFAYAFTDFADSGSPLALWSYTRSGMENVTRDEPALVRRDATTWWNAYRTQSRRKGDVRGLLAAWAADESLLGRAAQARTTLDGLARAGRLEQGEDGAKGAAYVRQLWRFLARHGYLG
jgi:hypothetical protein